jgi:uncharacterized membrane protein YqiK
MLEFAAVGFVLVAAIVLAFLPTWAIDRWYVPKRDDETDQ